MSSYFFVAYTPDADPTYGMKVDDDFEEMTPEKEEKMNQVQTEVTHEARTQYRERERKGKGKRQKKNTYGAWLACFVRHRVGSSDVM